MLILKGDTPTVNFLLVDANGDPVTGAAPKALISKNGGSFAPVTNAIAEVGTSDADYGKGWYSVALTTTETDTDGELMIVAGVPGSSLEWRFTHQVYTSLVATIADTFALAAANFTQDAMNAFADSLLRRGFTAVQSSSFGDPLKFRSAIGGISKLVNRVDIEGNELRIFKTNDADILGIQVVDTNANAAPVTGLITNEPAG